jgi:hypothetical protein
MFVKHTIFETVWIVFVCLWAYFVDELVTVELRAKRSAVQTDAIVVRR